MPLPLKDQAQPNVEEIKQFPAVERRRYNDLIRDYNTYVELFPNNIFARWAGFEPNNTYFTAPDASRAVPAVHFPAPATGTAK